jgi:hypothetical protein
MCKVEEAEKTLVALLTNFFTVFLFQHPDDDRARADRPRATQLEPGGGGRVRPRLPQHGVPATARTLTRILDSRGQAVSQVR